MSFSLAEVYEELLLRLGAKASDGGQLFTPREIMRAMVRVLDPQIGQTIYDPACGTGGFLTQAYEFLRAKAGHAIMTEELATLRQRTFYGCEKDGAAYPMALANLVFHGIDEPHLWHGDALSGEAVSGILCTNAPETFDYVLAEPPFGTRESKEAQAPYEYKAGAAQVLYLQHVLRKMKTGSRGGLVLDAAMLSRTDADAFAQVKRQLLEECDVYCIVNLPAGVLSSVGASARTHLVFFDKGWPTERIWYYDLSEVKVGKKTPLTLAHFEEFFRLLPMREESERSWTEDFAARRQIAQEQAHPHREYATDATARAAALEAAWRAAHETMSTPEELHAMEGQWKAVLQEAHAAAARADGIEHAAYDLASVHPNHRRTAFGRSTASDFSPEGRSAEELLAVMVEQGKAVDDALARLKALLALP